MKLREGEGERVCGGDIALDLGEEFGRGRERLFRAKECVEMDVESLVVKVSGEVEKVDLERRGVGAGIGESRAKTEIGDTADESVIDLSGDDIDAERGQEDVGGREVCGGDAVGGADLASVNDGCPDGVWVTEHGGGAGEVAGGDGVADAGGRDGGIFVEDVGGDRDGEMVRNAE